MPTHMCKLILLGNGSVGKSSIVARFVEDGFQPAYKQTVGLDFFEKTVCFGATNETTVTMQVWDIGGQNVGSKMLEKYITDSQAIMLCYDITDRKSFEDLQDWLQLVRKAVRLQNLQLPHMILVGNKHDLLYLRQVTQQEHDRMIQAENLNGGYLVSAKSGDKVLSCIYLAAGTSCGVQVSAHDLSFTDKVLTATVVRARNEEEEGRTSIADQIEAEDRALEEAKARKSISLRRKLSSHVSCGIQ